MVGIPASYKLPDMLLDVTEVHLRQTALESILAEVNRAANSAETGGILLGRVEGTAITVELAGDPGPSAERRPDFFDRDLRAIYRPPLKLISSSRGTFELFDLEADPDELENLAQARSPQVEALVGRIEEITSTHPPLFRADSRAELREETEEALRALGYLD